MSGWSGGKVGPGVKQVWAAHQHDAGESTPTTDTAPGDASLAPPLGDYPIEVVGGVFSGYVLPDDTSSEEGPGCTIAGGWERLE